ncbi:hypothetical protein IFR05_003581 [Cadophora sp. M221]|nr:hypothetical protein IFR05_003581 [Cadophora sp. M221]
MNSYLLQFLEWFYQDSVQCPDFRPRDRPMEILLWESLDQERTGTKKSTMTLIFWLLQNSCPSGGKLRKPNLKAERSSLVTIGMYSPSLGTFAIDPKTGIEYSAISDLPAIMFAKELIEAYPEAKIILSTRDVDAWHRSMALSIDANAHDKVRHFMQLFHPLTFQYTVFTKIYHIFFQGDFKNQGRNVYEEYNAMIRGLAPKDRFLEYHVSEGWEPLCEFLGKDVPKREMLNENSGKVFQERFEKIQEKWKREIYWNVGRCLGTVAFVGLAVGSFFWQDLLFEKLKRLEGLRRFPGIVKTVRYK